MFIFVIIREISLFKYVFFCSIAETTSNHLSFETNMTWSRWGFQSVSFVLKNFYAGSVLGLGVGLGLGMWWVLGLGIGLGYR